MTGRPFNHTTKATWETIHRAVSGGKLCPSKHEESAATMRKFFRDRAVLHHVVEAVLPATDLCYSADRSGTRGRKEAMDKALVNLGQVKP